MRFDSELSFRRLPGCICIEFTVLRRDACPCEHVVTRHCLTAEVGLKLQWSCSGVAVELQWSCSDVTRFNDAVACLDTSILTHPLELFAESSTDSSMRGTREKRSTCACVCAYVCVCVCVCACVCVCVYAVTHP